MTVVDGYWKTSRVCEYLGDITPRTLHRWRNRKSNPFPTPIVQPGAEALYPVNEVVAWAANERIKTDAA